MFYCCVLSALLLLCVICRPSENKVKFTLIADLFNGVRSSAMFDNS